MLPLLLYCFPYHYNFVLKVPYLSYRIWTKSIQTITFLQIVTSTSITLQVIKNKSKFIVSLYYYCDII